MTSWTVTVASIIVLIMMWTVRVHAASTNEIDHGPMGSANLDFFDPDPETQRLVKTMEFHHLNAPYWDMYRVGRFKDALREVKFVLDRCVNHPQGFLQIQFVAKQLGQLWLPLEYFERALEVYPQYSPTWTQYGMYLLDIGRAEPALAKFREALQRDPESAEAHAGIAMAYRRTGNDALAREHMQRAQALGYRGDFDSVR